MVIRKKTTKKKVTTAVKPKAPKTPVMDLTTVMIQTTKNSYYPLGEKGIKR
jgi:hypothetical protein